MQKSSKLCWLVMAVAAATSMAHAGQFSNVFDESSPASVRAPLSMTLSEIVSDAGQAEKYDVTLHVTTGCPPCVAMKRSLAADARLNVTESLNVIPAGVPATSFPFVTFRDAAGTIRYNFTVRTADEVVRLIERNQAFRQRRTPAELLAIARDYRGQHVGIDGMTAHQHLTRDHGYGPEQLVGLTDREMGIIHSATHSQTVSATFQVVATAGSRRANPAAVSAGTIHGRSQITEAIEWIRANIGEGVKMRAEWDRTGAQSLPMLKGSAWTPSAIYGRSGEFRLSAVGAISLPVHDATLGYRLSDGRLRLRGEAEIDASVLDWSRDNRDVAQAGAVGIVDPMTILTVISVLNAVWQMAHPTMDVLLPPNISCEAVLIGDMLKITFTQLPSIRIIAWWTFQLGVQSVDVSPSRVHIALTGSRWITEKNFEVAE